MRAPDPLPSKSNEAIIPSDPSVDLVLCIAGRKGRGGLIKFIYSWIPAAVLRAKDFHFAPLVMPPPSQSLSCSIPLLPSPNTSFSCPIGPPVNITRHSKLLFLVYAAPPALPNPVSSTANVPFIDEGPPRRLHRPPPPAASPADAFLSCDHETRAIQQPNCDTTTTIDENHLQSTHLAKRPTTRLPVEHLLQTLRALPRTSPRIRSMVNRIETDRGFGSISIFNYLLTALVAAREFELALKLSSNLLSYRLAPDHRTHSILVTCYCYQNDPFSARGVLDQMMLEMDLLPNVATFTTVINAFCKDGRMQGAFEVFEIMNRIGCEPTINTYNCLLKGLCYVGRIEEAYDLLRKIKSSTKKPDIYTYTALMNGYCKVGRSDEAFDLLDEALKMGLTPNAVTYNTLLNGFFKEGRPLDGIDLLKRMQEGGYCPPDYVSYNTLLHGLLKWGEIWAALDVYKEMVVIGFEVDERLMNALLRGLCRRARREDHLLKDVYDLFWRMRNAGCVICHPAYDLVIEALCRGKEVQKAFESLSEMIRLGTPPRSITFRRVVRALCRHGKVEEAVSILDLMHLDNRMAINFSFDDVIEEMNRCGMLVSAWNVYGAAIKRGFVPRRKPRDRSTQQEMSALEHRYH